MAGWVKKRNRGKDATHPPHPHLLPRQSESLACRCVGLHLIATETGGFCETTNQEAERTCPDCLRYVLALKVHANQQTKCKKNTRCFSDLVKM
ncbi:unnamed protein product [Protopolystoma xenopodis]|uniref:Uncharacterized protein n=1 Tax=Protopolystoma xenopodis TaxID=117903 RepID=A0A3S5ABJ4_9PLAT|nr:unnamed protein product [Protopolystoma xenopodis]